MLTTTIMHTHTLTSLFTYFSFPYRFAEQSWYESLMNETVCGDVIFRISGDQRKKDESLVTHMLWYIHVHFRSQIQCMCMCILVRKDKWR